MIVPGTNVLLEVMRPQPSARVLEWMQAEPLAPLLTTAIGASPHAGSIGRPAPGGEQHDATDDIPEGGIVVHAANTPDVIGPAPADPP